jgi:hypothetical protein
MFADVPLSSFCRWIELARRGVVSGCGGGNCCHRLSHPRADGRVPGPDVLAAAVRSRSVQARGLLVGPRAVFRPPGRKQVTASASRAGLPGARGRRALRLLAQRRAQGPCRRLDR